MWVKVRIIYWKRVVDAFNSFSHTVNMQQTTLKISWQNWKIIIKGEIAYKSKIFSRIALAIPVYRLAMSVHLSVCPSTFLLTFQVEAKSQHWKGLQT